MHRKIISIHSHTFTVTSLAPSEDVGEGVVGRGHCLQVCLYLLLDSFFYHWFVGGGLLAISLLPQATPGTQQQKFEASHGYWKA